MKNISLLFIAIMLTGTAGAQIINASFENWQTDTTYFLGFPPYLAVDTASTYLEPAGWTSTNSITATTSLGSRSFVTQSDSAVYGSYSVQVITDTLPKIENEQFTLPGFLINGNYQINVADFITGSSITPLSATGAGQPFSQRLADFKGYYEYQPVFNPNTNANDTCLIWATLRKGSELIANAIFKSTNATTGFQSFNVPFTYVSCDMPDTLVILISASIPYIPGLFAGQSNLVPGSLLRVDTLSYDTLNSGYVFPPVAAADTASTIKNHPVNIYVKANDMDCSISLDSLAIIVTSPPSNGTTSVNIADSFITYTPNNNFTGSDTFYYIISYETNSSSPAMVVVQVNENTGIAEIPQIPVLVYPVPATDELNIRFENKGNSTAKIYDMVGNLAGIFPLTGNSNTVSLSNLSNGAYNLQIVNDKNQVLANTRFVVNR